MDTDPMQFLTSILDLLPFCIYVVDRQGNFVYVNDKYAKELPMSKDEILKTNVNFFTKNKWTNYSVSKIVTETRETAKILQVVRTPAGRLEKQLYISSPIFDKNGEVAYVVGTMVEMDVFSQYYRCGIQNMSIADCMMLPHEAADAADQGIVAESPVMAGLIRDISTMSKIDSNVLISGESGTGKEVIARYLHKCSGRAGEPFVDVSCANFTNDLLEMELFGYEKGSFTGALNTGKTGLIESADRGTFFLDEIGTMPLPIQSKLLRVLETKTVMRIGAIHAVPVDFRLIAATNEDLAECVRKGTFRADLYYRLNVLPIRIPPLRERREDIIPLAKHFLGYFSKKYGIKKEATDDFYADLLSREWKGNVRELRNFIERILVIGNPYEIKLDRLSPNSPLWGEARPEYRNSRPSDDFSEPSSAMHLTVLEQKERAAILDALRQNGGNRTHTAQKLGISRRTLQYRIKKYGVQ